MSLGSYIKLKLLLDQLSSDEWTEQMKAAQGLGELGDPRAVPDLARELEQGERYPLREAVAQALGKFKSPEACQALLAGLDDEATQVRIAVVQALVVHKNPEIIPRLVALLRSTEDELREVTVQALAIIGEPVIPWLPGLLLETNFQTRQAAARTLGLIGLPACVKPLVKALRDEDFVVRREGIEALARFCAAAEPALLEALQDGHSEVRLAAIRTLGKLKDSAAIPPLLAAAKDPEPELREAAWHALALLNWTPAHSREQVQRRVAQGRFDEVAAAGDEAVEPLIEAFRAAEKADRPALVESLSKLGAPAIGPLKPFLKDREVDVRQLAARLLVQLGWQPVNARERVDHCLAAGKYEQALEAGTEAIEPVSELLRSPHAWDRMMAAKLLGDLKDSRALPALQSALEDPEYKVRERAATALGQIGGAQATQLLQTAIKDRHFNVQSASRAALKTLGIRLEA